MHGEGSTQSLDADRDSGVVLLPLPYEVLGGQAYCSEGGAFLHRPHFHENHEANKYSVNQTLPEVVRPSKAVAVSVAIKRSLTYDDVGRGGRHSELLAGRREMFSGGDSDVAHIPRSLLQREDQKELQEQLATRAKTLGCLLDASEAAAWSQDERRSDGAVEHNRKSRAMNITDFLC
jgi:hypothetical protein